MVKKCRLDKKEMRRKIVQVPADMSELPGMKKKKPIEIALRVQPDRLCHVASPVTHQSLRLKRQMPATTGTLRWG